LSKNTVLLSNATDKRFDEGNYYEIRDELSGLSLSVVVVCSFPTLPVQAATSNFCCPWCKEGVSSVEWSVSEQELISWLDFWGH